MHRRTILSAWRTSRMPQALGVPSTRNWICGGVILASVGMVLAGNVSGYGFFVGISFAKARLAGRRVFSDLLLCMFITA
jgi:hypothetical protein